MKLWQILESETQPCIIHAAGWGQGSGEGRSGLGGVQGCGGGGGERERGDRRRTAFNNRWGAA